MFNVTILWPESVKKTFGLIWNEFELFGQISENTKKRVIKLICNLYVGLKLTIFAGFLGKLRLSENDKTCKSATSLFLSNLICWFILTIPQQQSACDPLFPFELVFSYLFWVSIFYIIFCVLIIFFIVLKQIHKWI